MTAENTVALAQARTTADKDAEAFALRTEYRTATWDRQSEIIAALATMREVLYPEGTPEHREYVRQLTRATCRPGAWDFLDD
jgi:hypothetical protein